MIIEESSIEQTLERIAAALERQADALQFQNLITFAATGLLKMEDIRTQAIVTRSGQGLMDRIQEQHEREQAARDRKPKIVS